MAEQKEQLNAFSEFLSTDPCQVMAEYLTFTEITSLSLINKETNVLMNDEIIWEYQWVRDFAPIKSDDMALDSSFKQQVKTKVSVYGRDSIKYYRRVIACYDKFIEWSKRCLPLMIKTFNEPATIQDIQMLKTLICSKDMIRANNFKHLTAYLIFLGECADGQNRTYSRAGMFGYYSFYNKCSSGHSLSIAEAAKYTKQCVRAYLQDDKESADKLWLYVAGIPSQDRMISIPCLTFLDKTNGKVTKITQDSFLLNLKHGNANSFIDHMEFYIDQLIVKNNYRITTQVAECGQGILRFPMSDIATSESLTKGVVCRASPLFISELSNVSRNHFVFPYHIEIECPTDAMVDRAKACPRESKYYQLTEREWFIKDGSNGKVETVKG